MINYVDIIGYIGAFLISVAFLPQTIKTLKTKDTKGISLTCYLIYHLGLTLFIINGSIEKIYPLLAANIFGWIVNFFLLYLLISNKTKDKSNVKKIILMR